MWKVSKYGVFSGPYFPVFGLNAERKSPYSGRILENTDQKKLRIWTFFTQCLRHETVHIISHYSFHLFFYYSQNNTGTNTCIWCTDLSGIYSHRHLHHVLFQKTGLTMKCMSKRTIPKHTLNLQKIRKSVLFLRDFSGDYVCFSKYNFL